MTIAIVAILNGRTKQEWYAWIKERVEQGYWYPTPTALSKLYPVPRTCHLPELLEDAQHQQERKNLQKVYESHLAQSSSSARRAFTADGVSPVAPTGPEETLRLECDDMPTKFTFLVQNTAELGMLNDDVDDVDDED